MTTPDQPAPEMTSRSLEVEVPGTPEQVWQAIATGPGITCWFVPAEVAEHEGGRITQHITPVPEMDSIGTITVWDPPRRFAYEERDFLPDGASFATEFLIEARAGGTCVVRLISSMAGTAADWENELFDGLDAGWKLCLHNLQLYLTHFPGQRCSTIMAAGHAPGSLQQGWAALTAALGLQGAAEGDPVAAAPGTPALAGSVERAIDDVLMLRLGKPAPGVAFVHVFGMEDKVHAYIRAHLFGDDAPAIAARDEPAWRAWMNERFPLTDG